MNDIEHSNWLHEPIRFVIWDMENGQVLRQGICARKDAQLQTLDEDEMVGRILEKITITEDTNISDIDVEEFVVID